MVSQSAAQSLETAIEGHLDYVNENIFSSLIIVCACCLEAGIWWLCLVGCQARVISTQLIQRHRFVLYAGLA